MENRSNSIACDLSQGRLEWLKVDQKTKIKEEKGEGEVNN